MAQTKKAASRKSVKGTRKGESAGPKNAPAAPAAGTAPAAPAAEKHVARPKPTLTDAQRQALGLRREKDAHRPAFRRHEWWRYVRLGGKHAPWRVPRGIHSKTRRHWGYRPPLVSIGYRGPADVRGLHPSGFQEVLVHNVAEVARLDKATQAARVGGTVGARKQEQIEKEAARLGIRILNPLQGGA